MTEYYAAMKIRFQGIFKDMEECYDLMLNKKKQNAARLDFKNLKTNYILNAVFVF